MTRIKILLIMMTMVVTSLEARAAPLVGDWSITWTPTYNSCGTKSPKVTEDQTFKKKKSKVYKDGVKGIPTYNGGYKFKTVKTSEVDGVAGICIVTRKWSFVAQSKNKLKSTYKGQLKCPGVNLKCEIRYRGTGDRL